ncbi:MAG: hypothetical protein CVU06_04105 [Bacteroidetes bacterium HGW-Bacteroidetes-22]|nr:MAG: hypothetical protein CVU06_04105 [Bacteroidetes bacterium HGW-Bacteroidetes-22]
MNRIRCFLLPVFVLVIESLCFCQAPAGFIQRQLSPGLTWYSLEGDTLWGVSQCINVLEVDPERYALRLVSGREELKTVSTFAKESGAVAAVNGNFFHTVEGGSVCFTKVDGVITDTTRYNLPPRWFLDQLDDAALVSDGQEIKIILCPPDGWKSAVQYSTIISAGPPLLIDGKLLPISDQSFNTRRYGRTAVGITAGHRMILLTVSGNAPLSQGFTMPELQKMMSLFGCVGALNFDGGSSATMWIGALPENKLVSHPGKGRGKSQHNERKVANSLIIIPRR